jgi:nucleoside-triphosphatase THEP1
MTSGNRDLSATWLTAALLGSVWATMEIVVGSFLHNLGFPFAGTILAAIGTILLVAGTHLWQFPGNVWRAGLVCALMKSVSPSAVIFGPMIGILLEALVMEGAVLLFGRNIAAYILGGVVAVATPLFQKIASILILYGWDGARLYVAIIQAATDRLGITGVAPLDLIFVVLLLHLFLGAVAAIMGYVAGQQARLVPEQIRPDTPGTQHTFAPIDPGQHYSVPLLFAHVILVAVTLAAIGVLPFEVSTLCALAYAGALATYYPTVRRRLYKPRLWIELCVVALLAGFLLGRAGQVNVEWSLRGIQTGAQMALRAVVVVVAFSAVSVELRNPAVLDWFLRRGMGNLAAAIEVAFEALPFLVKTLGEQRKLLTQPLRSTVHLLSAARDWVGEFHALRPQRVFILSGDRGSGKTRLLGAIAETLVISGRTVGGILSPVVEEGDSRLGYDVQDIRTGKTSILCRRDIEATGGSAGPFRFSAEGIAFGTAALLRAATEDNDLLIVDEIGPLEFDGGGWGHALPGLLEHQHAAVLLVVRQALVQKAIGRWNLAPVRTWNAADVNKDLLTRELLKLLGRRKSST